VCSPEFEENLRAAQTGDEQAFAVLFRGVQPVLLRYLKGVSHNLADGTADDVAAETWVVRGGRVIRTRQEWRVAARGPWAAVALSAALLSGCTGDEPGGEQTSPAPPSATGSTNGTRPSKGPERPAGGRKSALCRDNQATMSGTSGPDHVTRTRGREVIVTFGGDDLVEDVARDDLVCTGLRGRLPGGGQGQ